MGLYHRESAMAWNRRLGRFAIVAVIAVACAVGGSAVGYAASKSKPLSSVCVAKKGTHALTAPGMHGCRKGSTRTALSSAVRGAKGPKGDRGAPGNTSIVRPTVTNSLPARSSSSNIAPCPAGTTTIGGGYDVLSSATDIHVYRSTFNIVNGVPTGWDVAIVNDESQPVSVTVTAICARN